MEVYSRSGEERKWGEGRRESKVEGGGGKMGEGRAPIPSARGLIAKSGGEAPAPSQCRKQPVWGGGGEAMERFFLALSLYKTHHVEDEVLALFAENINTSVVATRR